MTFEVDFESSNTDIDVEFETSNNQIEIPEVVIRNVITPTASVSKVGTVSTLTVHDINGTTTAQILDGSKGDKGDKGDTGEKGDKGDKGDPGPAGTTTWEGIVNKPSTFPPSSHTHDDRYYTETETDELISEHDSSDESHQDIRESISNKSDIGHTHDSRYYTETETNSLLSGKANVVHNHDDRYYTETEVNTLLNGKASSVHNHDDRYYTETEVNSLLENKSNVGHAHDLRYYQKNEVNTLLSGKANLEHTHDNRYYTESEVDTKLANKAPSVHTHDDRYYTETEINSQMSGKENVSNKVTSLTSSVTDTQYPSAKSVYDTTENIREIAAGKNANYVINKASNPDFNNQNDSISVTSIVDITGATITADKFKNGDNIYVTDTDVPDRWVGSVVTSAGTTTATCYKLETAKVPVADVKKNNVSLVTNNVANIPNNLSDYADDATHRLVTDTEKTTWSNKQNAITSSNKLSADLLSEGSTNKLVSQSEKNTWNSKQPAGDYMTLNTDQTATSKKTLSYTEPIVLGGQETILNVLSTHCSEDMDAMWAGRVKIGNRDKTFLLGVYKQAQLGQPAICGLGAHSWDDSFEEVGAAWEDIYLNPDGDKAIYIGDHDWREGTGWFKVQNTGTDYNGKTYCNRGNIQSPAWREVATVNDSSTYATNETWSATKLNTQFGYKENTSNKVTAISSTSTNTQYPSAKCVYDKLALKQDNLTVNPATTSANLTSIGINGTNYALAGGTQVIWRTY